MEKKETKRQSLLHITSSIINTLNIYKKKKVALPNNKDIQSLEKFKCEKNDIDLFHFSLFIKKLFLSEKGTFDLDVVKLKEIIGEKALSDVFNSIIKCIEFKTFLSFIVELGEIYSYMYLNGEDKFQEIICRYKNKGINNYQCLLKIISECKTDKNINYFYGNYDIFYSYIYFEEIKYNLILSIDIFIRLCVSSQIDIDKLDILSEGEKSTDFSDDKSFKLLKAKKYDEYIKKNLNIYWSNSYSFNSLESDDFMYLFADFITQNGSTNFAWNNIYDDDQKEFIKFMLNPAKQLFSDFNEESIKKFELSLFNYVYTHKDKNIKFIEKVLRIGKKNNFSNEEIGLISMLCCNPKNINEMEREIKLLNYDFSKENKDKVADKLGLVYLEISILEDMIEEVKKNKSENKDKIIDKIKNAKKNGKYDKIYETGDKKIINNEVKTSIEEKIDKVENNEVQKEKMKDNINQIIADDKNDEGEFSHINLSQNKSKDSIPIDISKLESSNNPEIIALANIIKNLQNQQLQQEKIQKEQQQQQEKMQKEFQQQIETYQKDIQEQNQKYEKKQNDMQKKIGSLKEDVNNLTEIHKKIYFRDVSKFYINNFAYKNKIEGKNTYEICQNILNYDFSENLTEFKFIITKIVAHYLNANKYSHIEFFIGIYK